MPGVAVVNWLDINDISAGTQTNDIKITLDTEQVILGTGNNNIGDVDVITAPPIETYISSGYYPDPSDYITTDTDSLIQNAEGALRIRGPIHTDEASFRDDFAGSLLSTNLTGTLTFTNGSDIVTGSGTLFTEEIGYQHYIRLSGDSDDDYIAVWSVISDTELQLDTPYGGTGGTGTGISSLWVPQVVTGGSYAIANSKAQLTCNTTNGASINLLRYADYPPYIIGFFAYISQRIVNQEAYIGLKNDNTGSEAVIVFNGTDNTKIILRTSWLSESQESEFVLPGNLTTDMAHTYQIEVSAGRVMLTVNGVLVGEHKLHIPGPYHTMDLHCHLGNSDTTTSSTTLYIDNIYLTNFNRVEISSALKGDPLPVRLTEDLHTLTGYLITTSTSIDQVILSYTVPEGKSFWILGYSVNNGETNVRGNPLKLGRNDMTTENVSPGTVDSNIFRAINMPSTSLRDEDFSAMPRRIGSAGDVIKMTVSPTGQTSTVWRASIGFVLR